jgi:hypothetical protein
MLAERHLRSSMIEDKSNMHPSTTGTIDKVRSPGIEYAEELARRTGAKPSMIGWTSARG